MSLEGWRVGSIPNLCVRRACRQGDWVGRVPSLLLGGLKALLVGWEGGRGGRKARGPSSPDSGVTPCSSSRRRQSTTCHTRPWPSSGCWSWDSSRTSPTSEDGTGTASPSVRGHHGCEGTLCWHGQSDRGHSILVTAATSPWDSQSRAGLGAALDRGCPGWGSSWGCREPGGAVARRLFY